MDELLAPQPIWQVQSITWKQYSCHLPIIAQLHCRQQQQANHEG